MGSPARAFLALINPFLCLLTVCSSFLPEMNLLWSGLLIKKKGLQCRQTESDTHITARSKYVCTKFNIAGQSAAKRWCLLASRARESDRVCPGVVPIYAISAIQEASSLFAPHAHATDISN